MKDPIIQEYIDSIISSIGDINKLLAELHNKGVEVRIEYVAAKDAVPANIRLWRAIEHTNYVNE